MKTRHVSDDKRLNQSNQHSNVVTDALEVSKRRNFFFSNFSFLNRTKSLQKKKYKIKNHNPVTWAMYFSKESFEPVLVQLFFKKRTERNIHLFAFKDMYKWRTTFSYILLKKMFVFFCFFKVSLLILEREARKKK